MTTVPLQIYCRYTGERSFKIGEHLAKLQAKKLNVSRTLGVDGYCPAER